MTLLEWYETGASYTDLMRRCEQLIGAVADHLGTGPTLRFGTHAVDLTPPWDRLSVEAAYRRYAGIGAQDAVDQGRFDEIMGLAIEPHLGLDRPVFLYDYPAACGALARLKPGDPSVAERFELYIAGMELCNAFGELTDAAEQRERFALENRARAAAGKSVYPTADAFLRDLACMPPAAGNALGIDRLAMLFCDAAEIDAVVAFVPEDL
jgi:lysyl-tRNA synthetase class 2